MTVVHSCKTLDTTIYQTAKKSFLDVNSNGVWPQYGKTTMFDDEEGSKPIYDLLRTISCTSNCTTQEVVESYDSASAFKGFTKFGSFHMATRKRLRALF